MNSSVKLRASHASCACSPQDLVQDYAATLDRIAARLRESKSCRPVFSELPPDTLHAEPATMRALLARESEAHGSMRDYLVGACGVDVDALSRLEDALLEPAG